MNHQSEIVTSIRGRYLCPVIVALTELGILDRLLAGPFSLTDFSDLKGQRALSAVIDYLVCVGVCEPTANDHEYVVTNTGQSLLNRAGAYLILESYGETFRNLAELLQSNGPERKVDRSQNIHGSGLIHRKKFFPNAIALMEEEQRTEVIDVGCGNGEFLSQVRQCLKHCRIAGLDASPIAVQQTRARLDMDAKDVVCEQAQNIQAWSELSGMSQELLKPRWSH